MSSPAQLDLVGIGWPVCLLKFKTVIDSLDSYEVLEVLAEDPDVVKSIILIIERSEDKLIRQEQDGGFYRLYVQRK